jgi:hypothetical protein
VNLPESRLELAWAVLVALIVALLALAVVASLLSGPVSTVVGVT